MNIQIDLTPLIEPFNLSADDINEMVDYTIKELTTRFANALEIEASHTLKETRLDYISNIQVIDEGFGRAAVMLTGSLPNAIEQGKDSYDMKPDLLNGPHAKVSKSGSKYNTIPFTWGTPGSLPENFSNIMPEPVYDIVKKKPIETGKNVSKGIVKDELPKPFQQPQVKQVKLPMKRGIAEYQHKHSIYEGIRKQKDHVTGQNRYTSFRRVSSNSDPMAWWHPGFDRLDLFGKTMQNFNVPDEVGRIIDEMF